MSVSICDVYSEEELIELAKRAIDESWNQSDFGHWCADDLGDEQYEDYWCMIMARNRDSDIQENSNYERVFEDLRLKYPPGFVADFRASHFAVGWVEHLCVRALTRKGKPTKIFAEALEIRDSLRDYCVYDEEDYSRREYEQTIENISNNLPTVYWKGEYRPEGWASDVYSWLSDYNPSAVENRDGQGGWANEHEIKEALISLDMIYFDLDEDDWDQEILERIPGDELRAICENHDILTGDCEDKWQLVRRILETYEEEYEPHQYKCKNTMEIKWEECNATP